MKGVAAHADTMPNAATPIANSPRIAAIPILPGTF
jgi:hypothetical protein